MGRMVQHILPKGMQRIRYYGLHGTAVYQKVRKKLRALLPLDASQCQETFTIARKDYRQRVIETKSKDPFICSRCGGELMLWRIWHPSYGVIYEEEERIKAGYYERDQRRRDPDVGDIRYPLLQLSLPGLWVWSKSRGHCRRLFSAFTQVKALYAWIAMLLWWRSVLCQRSLKSAPKVRYVHLSELSVSSAAGGKLIQLILSTNVTNIIESIQQSIQWQ